MNRGGLALPGADAEDAAESPPLELRLPPYLHLKPGRLGHSLRFLRDAVGRKIHRGDIDEIARPRDGLREHLAARHRLLGGLRVRPRAAQDRHLLHGGWRVIVAFRAIPVEAVGPEQEALHRCLDGVALRLRPGRLRQGRRDRSELRQLRRGPTDGATQRVRRDLILLPDAEQIHRAGGESIASALWKQEALAPLASELRRLVGVAQSEAGRRRDRARAPRKRGGPGGRRPPRRAAADGERERGHRSTPSTTIRPERFGPERFGRQSTQRLRRPPSPRGGATR